jgi:hypothetical protein
MTPDAKRIRPIGTVKIGTPLLVGIVLAVAAPVVVGWVIASGAADPGHEDAPAFSLAGPVTSVVITGLDGTVRVTGDPSVSGVSGRVTVDWHGQSRPQPVETIKDGVATLTFTRLPVGAHNNAMVSWDVLVPTTAAVTVTTSNASATLTGVGGAVDVTTSNASIRGVGLGDGLATFHTSNGTIEAAFTGAPPSIKAKSSNASVTITTDGKTRYFDRTTTSNGNTNRENDGQNDYTLAPTRMIDVETSNGSITIH